MDAPLSQSKLAQRMALAMGAQLQFLDDGGFHFSSSRLEGLVKGFPAGQLQEKLDVFNAFSVYEETALVTDYSYEIFVEEESPLRFRRFRDERLFVVENDDGLEYDLSPVSDTYLIWMLSNAESDRSVRDFGFGFISSYRADRLRAEHEALDPFDALRLLSGNRLLTLKVKSSARLSARKLQLLASSFLFHIAFNLDIAFVPVRFLEGISSRGRISRMRRSRIDEIDPPRRVYSEDLVAHYLLAISTDSPAVKFLSYYHVLEHFFESIFNDELIEKVRSHLTHPGFSYRRKKDVSGLIDNVKKSLQIRSETITFSESEALRLTLDRYIDLKELIEKINDYSASLLDYYRGTEVPFSRAAAVDLEFQDRGVVVRNLSKRIYATRNSLVHSKDGDKQRYVPFKDERFLIPEIPLMRFISEQVILQNSENP